MYLHIIYLIFVTLSLYNFSCTLYIVIPTKDSGYLLCDLCNFYCTKYNYRYIINSSSIIVAWKHKEVLHHEYRTISNNKRNQWKSEGKRRFCEIFIKSIERYLDKDWGDTCESDKIMNDEAVKTGDDRIVALYNHELGDIFIITEWDRSVTTVLFCDEY